MFCMLRNQFRKQTKNTAKILHLNYRFLLWTMHDVTACPFEDKYFANYFRAHWEIVSLTLLISHQNFRKNFFVMLRHRRISRKTVSNFLLLLTSLSAQWTPSSTRPWRIPWSQSNSTRSPEWSMMPTERTWSTIGMIHDQGI